MVRSAAVLLILGLLSSCGGKSQQNDNSTLQAAAIAGAAATQAGPPGKIVPVPGNATAVVALFPNGATYYSPDGYNLGGGGATVSAYSGSLVVQDIVSAGSGIDALLSDGSVYFSPDGLNLGGGGHSVRAYQGTRPIAGLVSVGGGVDAIFGNAGPVYYSPDGLNVGGGGNTVRVYGGGHRVVQLMPVGPGNAVVTLFDTGQAYYSPDNSDLGGGGKTVSATGTDPTTILLLVPVGGGVLTALSTGAVYLSPDGRNLAGGGTTVRVSSWDTAAGNGPFPGRDSARGAIFLGHLWLSGGYADPTNNNSCFITCSYFDLWSSTDTSAASWNLAFQTATVPNPRDQTPVVNNGVQDAPVPTDFYDAYSALTVWNGQLTAIGATVWRSLDGVTWLRNNLADGSAAPGPLAVHATENSRALILGGTLFFLQPDTGHVYSSTDPAAASWTDLGAINGFALRCGAAAFVLQGKLWLTGGGACDYSQVYHDLWSSSDGINWTQNASPAAWSARMWPCIATSADGVAWLVGGYAPTDWDSDGMTAVPRYGANHADVWYSKNGSDWKQYKAELGSGLPDDGLLEPRHAATCYVTGATSAELVVVAGSGGPDPDSNQAYTLNSIRRLPLPAAASLP